MGAVSPLHTAIKFWGTRGQYKEPDTPTLALGFKLGSKLRASIYLEGPKGEGETFLKGVQEMGGRSSRSLSMGLQHVPPADHIPGREVLEYHPGQGPDIQGVHLDQVPWLFHRVVFRLAPGVGTGVGVLTYGDSVG